MPHQTRDTMATHTYIAAGARAGVPYDTAVFTRLLSLSQRLPPVAYVGMGIFGAVSLTASYKSTHLWGAKPKTSAKTQRTFSCGPMFFVRPVLARLLTLL